MAIISAFKTWNTGDTLTSADLNSSFSTIINDYNGNITNANIAAAAGIAYSKLSLTGSVTNADLAGSIAYSKLSLANSILASDLLNTMPNNYVYTSTVGYNTTSTTFVNIDGTNLSKSLTTTNSHKVRIMLTISDITNSASSNPINVIQILRDSTVVGMATLQSDNPSIAAPIHIGSIDSPTTGAHTYAVQWKTTAGTLTALSQPGFISFSVEEIIAG